MNVSPVAFGLVVSLLLHVLVLGGYAQDAAGLFRDAVLELFADPADPAQPSSKPTPPAPAPKPAPRADSPPEPKAQETQPPPEPPPAPEAPRADPPPPPEPEIEDVVPGIENGAAESMNWIGYAEYEEHLARLALQEQAAFDLSAAGGGSPSVTAQAQPLPKGPEGQAPTLADRPSEPEPAPSEPATAEPPAPPVAVAQATPPQSPSALPLPAIPTDPTASERAPSPEPLPPADHPLPPTPPVEPATEPATPTPVPEVNAPKPAVPAQPTAPTSVQAPGQERDQVPPKVDAKNAPTNPDADEPGPATDGARSDKQSAATSVIDVPAGLWKNGKPLARKGLNIKTRRVELTTLTQVSGNFRNPQCDIYFDHTGKPVKVVVVESSGQRMAVDEPVVDTLYRWRASGQQISQLKEGQMVRFRVRIFLR